MDKVSCNLVECGAVESRKNHKIKVVNKMRKLFKYLKRGLIIHLIVLIDLEENDTFKKIYKNYLNQIS